MRGFVRRLRRRWPDLRIVLALWNAPEDQAGPDRAEALGVDQIVLSMDEAVQWLTPAHADRAAMQAPPPPADEAARLDALAQTAVLDGRAREDLDDLAKRAADVFDVSLAFISAIDADAEYIVGQSADLPGRRTETEPRMNWMPRAEAMCNHVIAADDTLVVPDTDRDVRFSDNPAVRQWQGRFYVGTPLRTADGHVLGALCLMDREPRQIEDAELDLLDKIAADVVAVMTDQDAVPTEPRREEPPAPAASWVSASRTEAPVRPRAPPATAAVRWAENRPVRGIVPPVDRLDIQRLQRVDHAVQPKVAGHMPTRHVTRDLHRLDQRAVQPGSVGGGEPPGRPSTSWTAPIATAATGVPQAIASIAVRPKGSSHCGVNSSADARPYSAARSGPAKCPPKRISPDNCGRTCASK